MFAKFCGSLSVILPTVPPAVLFGKVKEKRPYQSNPVFAGVERGGLSKK